MNPRMLVEDIVAEGMIAQGIGGDRRQRRVLVERLLGQVGMQPTAADRYPHEFSGGQRQRVAIARSLVTDSMDTTQIVRIREEMGVPLEIANDGDVTALAGSMPHSTGNSNSRPQPSRIAIASV